MGGDRTGWEQVGKFSPFPRKIIKPDKTWPENQTRPDTDKGVCSDPSRPQTHLLHRIRHYCSRITGLGITKNRFLCQPGITKNQMLPQYVGVTEGDIVYTIPADTLNQALGRKW